jgi:hypothetical protein
MTRLCFCWSLSPHGECSRTVPILLLLTDPDSQAVSASANAVFVETKENGVQPSPPG